MIAHRLPSIPSNPLETLEHVARNPYLRALDPKTVESGRRLLALPLGTLLPSDDADAARILALACEFIAETQWNERADALALAFHFRSRLPLPVPTDSYDADLARLHAMALGMAAGQGDAVALWLQTCPPVAWALEGLLWPRRQVRSLVVAWDALVGADPEAARAAGVALERLIAATANQSAAYLRMLDVGDQPWVQKRLFALASAVQATEQLIRHTLASAPVPIPVVSVNELFEQAQLITPDETMQRIYGCLRDASRQWGGGLHA